MNAKKPIEEVGGTYQTGVTQPGKSYLGVIAVLLTVVIFLTGVVTALGLMNVELFRQLQSDGSAKAASVSFDAPTGEGADVYPYARMDVGTQVPELGIWYVMVSGVCNQYYDIPMGPMVTSVGTQTRTAGIRGGDVLRFVKGQKVSTAEELKSVLEACQDGETVAVVFYRPSEKKQMEATLSIEK